MGAKSGSLRAARLAVALLVLAAALVAYCTEGERFAGLRTAVVSLQFSAEVAQRGIASVEIAVMLIVAVVTGRLFCSALCPFGTLQECAWRAARFAGGKPGAGKLLHRGYIKTGSGRYAVLFAAAVGLALAIPPLFIALDPLSNFGRFVASIARAARSYPLTPYMAASIAFGAAIIVLSAVRGRRFCDWCPVGTLLGLFARTAPFRLTLTPACVRCGACEKACPTGCIDAERMRLEAERCVLCFECRDACNVGAISYGRTRESDKAGRRNFMRKALGWGGAAIYLLAGTKNAMQGATPATIKKPDSPILPPGALSLEHYSSRCVSCQACVVACPVGIISSKRAHPELDYSRDYCQYNCTECSRTCPTGALVPLSEEEKRTTQVAVSSLDLRRCVVVEKKQECGACAESCPTHAVRMELPSDGSGMTVPVFDERYCIGCGACFVVCPAIPNAFALAASDPHGRTPGIRPSDDSEHDELPGIGDEFPF